MRRSIAGVTLPIATLALALSGCGGSGHSGSPANTSPSASGSATTSAGATASAPADEAAATVEITTAWQKFFYYKTPRAQQIALLENGDKLGPAVKFAAQLQAQQGLKQVVKVSKVSFTTPTQAAVSYALLNGTLTLLPAASGNAVLVGTTWKVSEQTFCTLVILGNLSKPVPSCPSP
jgi:hypothetical protein